MSFVVIITLELVYKKEKKERKRKKNWKLKFAIQKYICVYIFIVYNQNNVNNVNKV